MIPLLALAATALAPDSDRPPAHRAQGNLAQYFNDSDYPRDAARRNEQGVTGFTLDIDATGRVSACRVTESSGSASLDEATCRIAQARAQFEPARDRRGRPVPDRISRHMRWVLPEDPATRAQTNLASYISDSDYPAAAIRAGEQGTVGFQLQIGADGRVSDCRVEVSSGSAALDEATCRIMRARARFIPARDANGKAVPDFRRARIRWVLPPPEILDLTPYISGADYPFEAIRRRESGRVDVQLNVSSGGRVTRCAVTRSSGSALLDSHTCDLVRDRAEFRVADQSGRSVGGVVNGFINWVLPAH